jgi:hypothetical protein
MSSIDQIHAAMRTVFEKYPEVIQPMSAEDIGRMVIEAITPKIVGMLVERDQIIAEKDKMLLEAARTSAESLRLLEQCRERLAAFTDIGNGSMYLH